MLVKVPKGVFFNLHRADFFFNSNFQQYSLRITQDTVPSLLYLATLYALTFFQYAESFRREIISVARFQENDFEELVEDFLGGVVEIL